MAEELLEKEVLDGAAIDELIRTQREQQQRAAALTASGDKRA
jgi:hypothetical protein